MHRISIVGKDSTKLVANPKKGVTRYMEYIKHGKLMHIKNRSFVIEAPVLRYK